MIKKCIHFKVWALLVFIQAFFSCSELIEVEDITHKVVEIIAPLNDTVLNDTIVSFTWEPINAAETYHLQVATPSFLEAAQVVADTLVSSLNYSQELYIGQFEWRIRGQNSAYQTQYTTQSFTIEE